MYVEGGSAIHRSPPQCKVLALLVFVLAVALAPREAIWVFAVDALLLLVIARASRTRLRSLLRGLMIEIPFLLFALILPFTGGGESLEILGLTLQAEGAWAAWNIFAKATLGVMASLLVAATTTRTDILWGLECLKAPKVMVAIAALMIRYSDVVSGEAQRMSVARISRGYDPRWLWQVRALAGSIAPLFVRAFERGERVYLAMLSRGFSGSMPSATAEVPLRAWLVALILPSTALSASLSTWFQG